MFHNVSRTPVCGTSLCRMCPNSADWSEAAMRERIRGAGARAEAGPPCGDAQTSGHSVHSPVRPNHCWALSILLEQLVRKAACEIKVDFCPLQSQRRWHLPPHQPQHVTDMIGMLLRLPLWAQASYPPLHSQHLQVLQIRLPKVC